MQVTYNGFTGELLELKRSDEVGSRPWEVAVYNLFIYDREKAVTYSFTGVKLEDVKFLGGEVAFGG